MGSWLYLAVLLVLGLFMVACAAVPQRSSLAQEQGSGLALGQQEIPHARRIPISQFSDYLALMQEGPLIPGLLQGAVPQGKAYIPEADLLVISSYMSQELPGVLTFVSLQDFELKKVLWLYNQDGSMHQGHLGGLARTREHLWIASDRTVYRVPLQQVLAAEAEDMLFLGPGWSTEVRASFATASQSVLYVGEFRTSGKRYATKPSHAYSTAGGGRNQALMAAFPLDSDTDDIQDHKLISGTAYPAYFISIPDRVQGAAFAGNHIILSQSYGRRNSSSLSVYRAPFAETSEDVFEFENGLQIPVWHLDSSRHVRTVKAPPMSEGIARVNGQLAVLFESGAGKFSRFASLPLDRVQLVDLELLLRE
ncbi:MAG: hypothetical protein ACLFMQ_04610 [Desulfohalobiaceae bacterium]